MNPTVFELVAGYQAPQPKKTRSITMVIVAIFPVVATMPPDSVPYLYHHREKKIACTPNTPIYTKVLQYKIQHQNSNNSTTIKATCSGIV